LGLCSLSSRPLLL
jgi:hypothetical protein